MENENKIENKVEIENNLNDINIENNKKNTANCQKNAANEKISLLFIST